MSDERHPMPHPNDWPRQRLLAGDFSPLPATFAAAGVLRVLHAIAGCAKGRLYFKTATDGGTLSFRFIRPTPNAYKAAASRDAYDTLPVANVTQVAGTETQTDFTFSGEELLEITFTGGATGGTVVTADFMGI